MTARQLLAIAAGCCETSTKRCFHRLTPSKLFKRFLSGSLAFVALSLAPVDWQTTSDCPPA